MIAWTIHTPAGVSTYKGSEEGLELFLQVELGGRDIHRSPRYGNHILFGVIDPTRRGIAMPTDEAERLAELNEDEFVDALKEAFASGVHSS